MNIHLELQQWFATPIWYGSSELDLAPIKQKCLSLMQQGFANRTLSNVGGWQSTNINLYRFAEFRPLAEMIQASLDAVANTISPKFQLRLSNAWININKKGSRNNIHVHPQSALSGVFYVSSDENTGDIVFLSGSDSIHYPIDSFESPFFHYKATYKPANNMLFIFPSWLLHEVEESKSDIDRISIAFNTRQVNNGKDMFNVLG